MSDLTTTDLGQAGAAIEAEEARKVIEGLRGLCIEMRSQALVAAGYLMVSGPSGEELSQGLRQLAARIDAALGGKP